MSKPSNNERIRPPERGLYPAYWAAAGLLCVLVATGCFPPDQPPTLPLHRPLDSSPPHVWPHPDAALTAHAVRSLRTAPVRLFLDAGHGAPGNIGNVGSRCQAEQEHTLTVAEHCAERLGASRSFEVRVSRNEQDQPSYSERVEAAQAWKAHVFVSIHSDWRASAEAPATLFIGPQGQQCSRSASEAGFATFWSDEGALASQRATLARNIATSLERAGLLPYDGQSYGDAYSVDATNGVFIDRRGLLMLRRPPMMSTIIETHHAMLEAEVERWQERDTLDLFCDALASGVLATMATSSP